MMQNGRSIHLIVDRRRPIAAVCALALLAAGCADGGGGAQAPATRAATAAPARAEPAAPRREAPAPAASGPERLAYVPPSGRVGQKQDRKLPQPPGRLFAQVQPALTGKGLRITSLDERGGVIAATYAGDPSRFVDCGTIAALAVQGGERRIDGVATSVSFRRGNTRESVLVERDLTLNARVVVRINPDPAGARLRSQAYYVLSKRTAAGEGREERVETIAFESGGRAGFAKGTICQPTGALERLALATAGTT